MTTRVGQTFTRRRPRQVVRAIICILTCMGLTTGQMFGCAGASPSIVAAAEEPVMTAATTATTEVREFTSVHGGTWMGVSSSWFGRYYADGIDDDAHLSYCVDYTKKGDVNSTSFSNPVAAGPGTGYILQHGYPYTTDIAGTSWSAGQARAITQIALWYYNNGYHALDGNINTEDRWALLRPAAYALYMDADAYASGGGMATGYGTVYSPADPNVQTMLLATKPQPGTIVIEKSSDNVAVTGNNTSFTLEGAVYGLWKADGTSTGLMAVTDASGRAVFSNVAAGSYIVHETRAPESYLLDTTHGTHGSAADGTYDDDGWYSVTAIDDSTSTVKTLDTPRISIGTSARDSETDTNVSLADGSVTVIDTVSYESLVPGVEYVASGELHLVNDDGTDGGSIASSETSFVPANESGTVEVIFVFDGSSLAGQAVVAFETLTRDGATVATHADITDEGQTISFPRIGTELADENGYHEVCGDGPVVLVDTVSYDNLRPGATYVMTGRLVDAISGNAIVDEENAPIVATAEVVPTEAAGSVDVRFEVPAAAVAGKRVVAFETCSSNGTNVAVHADLHDESQTISVPKIGTTARDATTGTNVSYASARTTIVDTVSYEGLIPGSEYALAGELHLIGKNGQDAVIATAETSFVPNETSGVANVTFEVDTSELRGRSVVAFETLSHDGRTVAIHADASDANQTVVIEGSPIARATTPSTGDGTGIRPDAPVAMGIAAIVTGILLRRRKRDRATG